MMDIRERRFDLHATAGTSPQLTFTWTEAGDPYSLVGKTVTVYVGGTVDPDPTDTTGATEYAAAISSNTATVTIAVPEGDTVPLRLVYDGSLKLLGTLTPSTTGADTPDTTIDVNVGSLAVAVELTAASNPLVTTINVKAYGAVGDGVTDDTDAIDAAWTAAQTQDVPLEFPAGDFLYTGTGLVPTQNHFVVFGAGKQLTTITCDANIWFIEQTTYATRNVHLHDFTITSTLGASGYKGLLKNTLTTNSTGSNVMKQFDRLLLLNYTVCGVASNSGDSPYWHFTDCEFSAYSDVGSMGVALTGFPNQSRFTGCFFRSNQIHLKLIYADDVLVQGCSFLFTSGADGVNRASIWVVPTQRTGSQVSRHDGFTITASKFGAENNDAQDFRVLYAPEADTTYSAVAPWKTYDVGTSVETRFPALDGSLIPDTSGTPGSEPGGAVQGVSIIACKEASAGTSPKAFIHSYTPHVFTHYIGPLVVRGTPPPYILYIDPSVTAPSGDLTVYGNIAVGVSQNGAAVNICNVSGFVRTPTLT